MWGTTNSQGLPSAAQQRRVYSSAGLGGDKRSGWLDLVRDLYGVLDIDIVDERFRGEIRRSPVARLELTEISTDGETARRQKHHISTDKSDFFLFGASLAGVASYEQYGRACEMQPGHFGMIHTASPYLFVHQNSIHTVCLKLPAAALEARVADPHALCSIARPVIPGLSALIVDLLRSLTRQADGMCDHTMAMMETNLLDLIGLLMNGSRDNMVMGGTSVRWAIHRRALAYMTEALSRPDLNPASIAAGLGISTRYLHRVFEESDETVAEALMNMRLERSRALLVEPAMRPLSIKEIAYRNGFKSQSYFSGVFKAKYGRTPREMRLSTFPS